MTTLIQVIVAGNLYECLVKENVITRVTKYLPSGTRIETTFNDLPDKVKWAIVDKYNNRHNETEE